MDPLEVQRQWPTTGSPGCRLGGRQCTSFSKSVVIWYSAVMGLNTHLCIVHTYTPSMDKIYFHHQGQCFQQQDNKPAVRFKDVSSLTYLIRHIYCHVCYCLFVKVHFIALYFILICTLQSHSASLHFCYSHTQTHTCT